MEHSFIFALILGCLIKADCDTAEPQTTLNPGKFRGNPALVCQGLAQDNAPFANKRRPNEVRNREDLQFRPHDAAENHVEDEH